MLTLTLFITLMGVGLILGYGLLYYCAYCLVFPKRREVGHSPTSYGIHLWQPVCFTTCDTLTLKGWFVPPMTNRGVVVFVHGHGNNRQAFLPHAALAARQGYGVFLFDLRNHGQSSGAKTTLGHHETRDVLAALQCLQEQFGVSRVLLVGHSIGAAACLQAVNSLEIEKHIGFQHNLEIQGVVLISAFSSLEDNVSQGIRNITGLPPYPCVPIILRIAEKLADTKVKHVRPIDAVSNTQVPLLFIHGMCDKTVRCCNSKRLYRAARHYRRFRLVVGAGHTNILDHTFLQEYKAELMLFAARFLNEPSQKQDTLHYYKHPIQPQPSQHKSPVVVPQEPRLARGKLVVT